MSKNNGGRMDNPCFNYVNYNPANSVCSHIVLSDRAKAAIVSDVANHGSVETGGVFLGYIMNSVWYVVECIDGGIKTSNSMGRFVWDDIYVNHLFKTIRAMYNVPLSILGFWHRHPDSMDYFSDRDFIMIDKHLRLMQNTGLLTMLVNIDPDFRMTFYHAYGNSLMKTGYDVGTEYFPDIALEYADEKKLSANNANRGSKKPELSYERIVPLSAAEPFDLYGYGGNVKNPIQGKEEENALCQKEENTKAPTENADC